MEPGPPRKLRVYELSYEDPADLVDSDTSSTPGSEDDGDGDKPAAFRKRGAGTPKKRTTPAKKARSQA